MNRVVVQGLPGGPPEIEASGQMGDDKLPFSRIVVQGMAEARK
jgi:hypothetical protein